MFPTGGNTPVLMFPTGGNTPVPSRQILIVLFGLSFGIRIIT